ncbi:hypothetical protein LC609_27505 [Nostoc sp. XA013]|nr:hypothetical protein [Nostoc sp. XA013]
MSAYRTMIWLYKNDERDLKKLYNMPVIPRLGEYFIDGSGVYEVVYISYGMRIEKSAGDYEYDVDIYCKFVANSQSEMLKKVGINI